MSTYTFFYFLFLNTNPTDSNTKQGGEACAPHVIINNQLGEHLYHPFPKKKKKKNQNTKKGINSAKYAVVSRDFLILIKEEEEASTLLFIQLYIYMRF